MPATMRILMFALCSAMTALFGGCVGLPAAGRPAVADRGTSTGDDSAPIQQAAYEQPDHSSLTLTAKERTFPQQGWWCSEYEEWLAPARVEKGYTIILPGVEGTSWFNISIARGLVDAGHESAIEIQDWTTGYWPMFVYHLMALERNKARAREIAERIVAYQDQYPGRPVRLIGHSGGAAMSVLVLEALPEGRRIDQAVLLAGALSPDYDLSTALERTEQGITNYYSGGDVFYLVAGTLALGTLDRQHAVSAGAVGFRTPPELSEERRRWYASRLHQEPYRWEMARSLNLGGHVGPANRRFIAEWVAPRLEPRR